LKRNLILMFYRWSSIQRKCKCRTICTV